jgi:hypothetical protein
VVRGVCAMASVCADDCGVCDGDSSCQFNGQAILAVDPLIPEAYLDSTQLEFTGYDRSHCLSALCFVTSCGVLVVCAHKRAFVRALICDSKNV